MNSPSHLDPDDPEQLLRTGLRETTPEFEKRWSDLKRELRVAPAPHRAFPRLRPFMLFAAAGATAAIAFILLNHPSSGPSPKTPTDSPATTAAYVELLNLDSALRGALPLINNDNLEALLNLAPPNSGRS